MESEEWIPEELRAVAERRVVPAGWEQPYKEQRDGRLVAYFDSAGRLRRAIRVFGQTTLGPLSLDPDGSVYFDAGPYTLGWSNGELTTDTCYDGDSPGSRKPAERAQVMEHIRKELFTTKCSAAQFFTWE